MILTKGNGLTTPHSQPAKTLTNHTADFTPAAAFLSKLTQRQKIALEYLRHGQMHREALDRATGASNSPEVVRQLRKLGLEIPCQLIVATDRHGQPCRPGVYSLSPMDRVKLGGAL
jgi:hypothetical protein